MPAVAGIRGVFGICCCVLCDRINEVRGNRVKSLVRTKLPRYCSRLS